MNSDNPDQVMENNALRSKKQKKSKGKLKTDAAITDVIGRSQKKSFWKSLFRFKKHHEDPGNSSTHVITVELEDEEPKSTPNQRLSSIFEETADPATLDPKTIAEDISEIQKTIQKMSETSSPNVIIDKINQNYLETDLQAPKKRPKDDAFLGYLTDVSSTSSEDEEEEDLDKKLNESHSQPDYNIMGNQDNNSTYTDLLADDKPPKGSNSILKEGYSFEYSETSENSNDDAVEEKPEKVTFDNKVETKDTNSIIMVRTLEENDSKVLVEEFEPGKVLVEKDVFVTKPPEHGLTFQIQELMDTSEEDVIVARIHDIATSEANLPEEIINEENAAYMQDMHNLMYYQAPVKCVNRSYIYIPSENAIQTDDVIAMDRDVANRFVEESEPSTSTISKHSTYERQDLDETLDMESMEEETELWLEDLNDFPFISTADILPLEDLDDDANIDNEIYREFRLNKFFKMIQNNITMNVSIAYDPLFENEPMIQNFHSAIVEQEVHNEERNKVIRKRKMMSLLHDKQVFKDYMKEIEATNMETQTRANSSTNETEKVETANTIPLTTINNLIDINKVPRANIFNEATLLNLSSAKSKLEKFLIEENGIKNNVNAMFPKQYMRVYNLQTNRMNEDGLEETTSSIGTCSSSTEDLGQLESDTSVVKSSSNNGFSEHDVVEKLSPMLQKKISAYKAIDRDVEQLITELMGHVSDLKASCIRYGAYVSGESDSDLVRFQTNNEVYLEVKDILNEILDNVYLRKSSIIDVTKGHFNQCFSFIREFGQIEQERTSLSYQIKPAVKNYYPTENSVSLAENLHRANGYLSTVYEEMCEYNPIPMLESDDLQQFEDGPDVNNSEHIMYSDNLINFNYQPDFESELSIIHEEDEPNSSACELLERENAAKASINIAENLIKGIEKSVSEKLSGMGNCDMLQDIDDDIINLAPEESPYIEKDEDTDCCNSDNEMKKDEDSVTDELGNNLKPTESSNNTESNYQVASNSRNNYFEPQPGTSRQQPNCFIKSDKSSTTLCSSVYHLPSVPSNELICTENSSEHSGINKGVETLLMKQFSELPNSSTEDIKLEDLQALLAFHVPSNFSQGTTILERKSPQTNFVELLQRLNLEDTKNLTKTEVDKCIEENLKCFQESMNETIKLNQETIDMIQTPSDQINPNQTPDVLTIISTLSCNMPHTMLPDKSQVDETEVPTASTASSDATIKAETNPPSEQHLQQSQIQQPQEWYGNNNFFSKTKTNNTVPKLYQLSEKVYTKSETDNDIESLKDDTESSFSNHNFDVDTYTDISFEDSAGLINIKAVNSGTNSQSELSIDTQYLSCSNFSSGCDNSGKLGNEVKHSEETISIRTENVVDRTSNAQTAKLCSDLHNLVNKSLASQYLEKSFNFGINLTSLLNEEFERKTKLNFGEQM